MFIGRTEAWVAANQMLQTWRGHVVVVGIGIVSSQLIWRIINSSRLPAKTLRAAYRPSRFLISYCIHLNAALWATCLSKPSHFSPDKTFQLQYQITSQASCSQRREEDRYRPNSQVRCTNILDGLPLRLLVIRATCCPR